MKGVAVRGPAGLAGPGGQGGGGDGNKARPRQLPDGLPGGVGAAVAHPGDGGHGGEADALPVADPGKVHQDQLGPEADPRLEQVRPHIKGLSLGHGPALLSGKVFFLCLHSTPSSGPWFTIIRSCLYGGRANSSYTVICPSSLLVILSEALPSPVSS